MASTVTIDSDGRGVAGDKYVRRGTLNVGTYAADGIAVTATQFELNSKVDNLALETSGGYVPRYDKTNKKVMVYMQTDSDNNVALGEVGSTDLSATEFRFVAVGV